MSEFLYWLFQFLDWALYIYMILIVVYALMTWLPGASDSFFGRWVYKLVNPYLQFFDRVIPSLGGIGFSPLVALLVLYAVQWLVDFVGRLLMVHI